MAKNGILRVLDENFVEIDGLTHQQYTSLIWHEKMYDVGRFQISGLTRIPGAVYFKDDRFAELGIIEIDEIERDYTYAGRMMKAKLANKVIHYPQNFYNKKCTEITKSLVETYTPYPVENSTIPAANIPTLQVTGDNLLTFTTTLLAAELIGGRLEYDRATKTNTFIFLDVQDFTETKPPLSVDFKNIERLPYYQRDSEFYKNFAYVAGEGEGTSRIVAEVDHRIGGEEKREIYVDARTLRKEELTDAQYLEVLREKGREELALRQVELKVEVTPTRDIALGEKRVYKDFKNGIEAQCIATELIHTHEAGMKRTVAKLQVLNIGGIV